MGNMTDRLNVETTWVREIRAQSSEKEERIPDDQERQESILRVR